MYIFLVSGSIGAGKSLAADRLYELIASNRARITAFAKALKDDVAAKYNIERSMCETQEGKATYIKEYGMTVRTILIQYSASMKTVYGENIWANTVVDEIRANPHILTWILSDWRYPEEFQVLRAAFPAARIHTLRIVRPSVETLDIPSEHMLDMYAADFTILNDGTANDLSGQLALLPFFTTPTH